MPDERPISSSESALKATNGNVGAKNVFLPAAGFRIWPSVPDEKPISSSESALKATYGNVGSKKNFSPAAGFRPCQNNFSLQ